MAVFNGTINQIGFAIIDSKSGTNNIALLLIVPATFTIFKSTVNQSYASAIQNNGASALVEV